MVRVVAIFDSIASNSLKKRAVSCAYFFLGCLLVVVSLVSHGRANSGQDTSKEKSFQVERGITGTLNFRYPGRPIQAKAQRDIDAPFNVRVYPIDSKSGRYEARYLASIVGEYDLRDWIEHSDGSPVTDFPSLPIRVISTLPKDQRSDLFEAGDFRPVLGGGYRLTLIGLLLLWICIPVVAWIRRKMNAPPKVEPRIEPPPLTYADQLRPLVEAVASRALTIPEKARLELLLYQYWKERIQEHASEWRTLIPKLRIHPEAGPLITTIERWLHEPASEHNPAERSLESIQALLQPYSRFPASNVHAGGALEGNAS